jgi:hypothetical protein
MKAKLFLMKQDEQRLGDRHGKKLARRDHLHYGSG